MYAGGLRRRVDRLGPGRRPAEAPGMITAAAACIATDGKVTLEESELLRAMSAALACPAPPLAVGM